MNFYVGQEVLCINDKGAWGIKKGEIYVIMEITNNCKCGVHFVLDNNPSEGTLECTGCGSISYGRMSYQQWRFRPHIEHRARIDIPVIMPFTGDTPDVPVKVPTLL